MKNYNKNNIRLKVPAKWTGDDGLYLIVGKDTGYDKKQTIVITTQEARDISYVITKYFIDNDPDLKKVSDK